MMLYLSNIELKLVSDFFERFLLNAVTPIILILLIVYIIKCKKTKLFEIKPTALFLISYVFIDLLIRVYYTFFLGMENQTRYFMIQVLFYLIPAAIAWEYLSESKKINREKFYMISCCVIFLFGCIISLRLKWDKPEYEVFSKIIKADPKKYKHVVTVDEEDDGSLSFEDDVRLAYYSGIYKDKRIPMHVLGDDGSYYFVTERPFSRIGDHSVELIKDLIDDGDKKYLYKVVSQVSN